MDNMKLGDVVVDTNGQIGKIVSPSPYPDFRVTYKFPVLFPWNTNVLWYTACECREPTEAERKRNAR